jgi:hypothetical protein
LNFNLVADIRIVENFSVIWDVIPQDHCVQNSALFCMPKAITVIMVAHLNSVICILSFASIVDLQSDLAMGRVDYLVTLASVLSSPILDHLDGSQLLISIYQFLSK